MKFNCKNFAKALFYSKDINYLIKLFKYAKQEDKKQAMQILLWARDVNGGNIKNSILLLKYIAEKTNNINDMFLASVVKYGCFKDLNEMYKVASDSNKEKILSFYSNELKLKNQLAAKWAPRKGPLFYALANSLCLKIGDFRRYITSLYISVEAKMCDNMWDSISLDEIPERAIKKYKKALEKRLKITIYCRSPKQRRLKFKGCEKLLKQYY
ncbi:hypothetical protein CaPhCPX_gp112 [Campylobacter phage CPX]|uniref:Uncharacterized protein n=2 Tax=Fletchervirus TaxID=1636618 RepID=G8GJ24_9CAUD|nr:hypothetical protein CaPhCPX_gp112 [Campylobacter phage CPX]AET34409.1 hypothetical protein [Campylobacter phage CPX]AGS81282.1 hypothetical protein [Campylobacter phage CP8]